MKTITLQRIIQSTPERSGTFMDTRGMWGVLIDNDTSIPFAVTLEQPWRDNLPFISCIPADSYICSHYTSRRFPNTYKIEGVMGRTNILLHKGNWIDDTAGCIMVAEKFEVFGGEAVIADSKGGYEDLNELVKGEKEWRLVVKSPLLDLAP